MDRLSDCRMHEGLKSEARNPTIPKSDNRHFAYGLV